MRKKTKIHWLPLRYVVYNIQEVVATSSSGVVVVASIHTPYTTCFRSSSLCSSSHELAIASYS